MPSKAFWIEAPGRGAIRETPTPEPGPGQTLIRARFSGISRGTESLVFNGGVPESLAAVMRCPFQEGEFPGPLKYGYSAVGATDDGRRVFCLHPHQDVFVVPDDAVFTLPDGLPDRRAVLAANMETAINALWDSTVGVGDRIAVVGAGVVGCLVAFLCRRIPGTTVELIDIIETKAETAEALGVAFRSPSRAEPECDVVFHATGTAAGLQSALDLAGFEAQIVELSWYGTEPVSISLGEWFHPKRLTIRSSQVGHVSSTRRARQSRSDRLALALELLQEPAFDSLLTGSCRLDELPAVMPALAASPQDTLCHVVEYD